MRQFGIGQPLRRREDQRFVTGTGRYTDDIRFDGQLYGATVRAPVGYARIGEVDIAGAREADGVRLVLTAADLDAAGVGDIPCAVKLGGGAHKNRPVLARERVRHAGEPVAFIVADSPEAARAAVDLVMVDYDPLDAVTDVAAAGEDGAAQLFDDAPGNCAFDWQAGDAEATDAAFRNVAHVARVTVRNTRVEPVAMEPRGINASWSEAAGYEAWLGTQGVHGLLGQFAKLLGEDPGRIHLVTPDVGGGFGMKTFMYPDYILTMLAAKKLGRPVKWTASRLDSFLSDTHGRDLVSTAELALDDEGRILGYRIDTVANMGAYLSNFGPAIVTLAPLQVTPGPYRIPIFHQRVKGVYSNTHPVDAYRGAGRPEAAYLLERLIHQAAMDTGLGQDEIRRRNFITADEMPYTNAAGATYDSGDFARNMDDAMRRAAWDDFDSRRAMAKTRGRLRGIGLAYYVECTLGDPTEEVDVTFTEAGRVEVSVGTQSNGQGHETAYAQVFGDRLGIDPALVDIIQGDSARKATGGGTGGSRSLQMIGNACIAAADAVAERGKVLMAALHQADAADVGFADGRFRIGEDGPRLDVLDLAAKARAAGLPGDLADGLDLSASYTKSGSTFPNGCHICEVEIDPETGVTEVKAYTVVDDFGTVINPMLVAGQVHGGVVQGLGQALGEDVRYDEDGQLLSASFMDYRLPRADDFGFIDFSYNEIPCTTNPLGLKGCGEAGTIGACPAAIIAIIDALRPMGVAHIDMPATPLAVWRALQQAQRQAA